jgi:hypothetical protein
MLASQGSFDTPIADGPWWGLRGGASLVCWYTMARHLAYRSHSINVRHQRQK